MAAEGKPLPSLVASACGAKEAFVQKEFFSDEWGETRLKAHFGPESSKALPVPLASGKGYVGLEGAALRFESAEPCSCGDAFMEQEQFGGDGDADKEYTGTIEDAEPLKPYWNGGQIHFAQSRHNTLVFFLAGIAQELQSDVP